MNKLLKLLSVLALVTLGACAGLGDVTESAQATVAGDDDAGGLQKFTLADLRAASALADRTNDVLAKQCYEGLIPIVESFGPKEGEDAGRVIGAISAYQKVRNVRRTLEDGLSSELRDQLLLACGPMLTDSRFAIARLVLRFGL